MHIYFFLQGKTEDYPEFASFFNLHWSVDMGAQESFYTGFMLICL